MIKKLGLDKLGEIITLADKILIAVILILSISLMFLTPKLISDRTASDKQVVVSVDQQEVYRHHLSNSEELERIEFDFMVEDQEYQGVLMMKEGRVRLDRLSKSISPLPIHYEMGWISETYEMIVSLPIRMVVTVEAIQEEEQEDDIDAVNF